MAKHLESHLKGPVDLKIHQKSHEIDDFEHVSEPLAPRFASPQVGKNCDSDVVCLLVENNGDVTSRTSNYVRATRAHGNRGWDRGLTPLQICDYADQASYLKGKTYAKRI